MPNIVVIVSDMRVDYKTLHDKIGKVLTGKDDVICTVDDKRNEETIRSVCHAFKIPLTVYRRNWNNYGKKAAYEVNDKLTRKGDILLLIWKGKSRVCRSLMNQMLNNGKIIYSKLL